MVASLLKIISQGMQNERLQGPDDQPDLTFFKTVVVKTGRYGTQWARLDFDTMPDFGKSAIVRLVTQGELIGRILLVTQMPDIMTQQRKAYYTRKPIKVYSGNYASITLYEGTDYLTTVNFVYRGGPFTGVQLDNLIPGGTYSLKISKGSGLPTPFLAVLTEKPLTNAGFSLLTRNPLLIAGLTIVGTSTNLYAYSLDGKVWTPVTAPAGVSQGTINAIAYNGSYYISAGSCSGGPGLITLDAATTIAQPGDAYGQYQGSIRTFATNGTVLVAGGRLQSNSGAISYITLSQDGGLSWSSGYLSPGTNVLNAVNSIVWSAGLNQFIAGGQFISAGGDSLGLYSLSTPNDPTTWSSPLFPFSYGSMDLDSKSQVAISSLSTILNPGQPLEQWNSTFTSQYNNYSSIGFFAYGSASYPSPIFSRYNGNIVSFYGVYDLFNQILSAFNTNTQADITGSISGTTLSVFFNTMTVPCYITGPNVRRGTFVTSFIGIAYSSQDSLPTATYTNVTATDSVNVIIPNIDISTTGFLVTITNGVNIGGLSFPVTLSGGTLGFVTITLNARISEQYTVNISQTAATGSITPGGSLGSLPGTYAFYVNSLDAKFLSQLAVITTAIASLGSSSINVDMNRIFPPVLPVSDYYDSLQTIISNSQPSMTVDTIKTIISNLITPSTYNSTVVNTILDAKTVSSSYSTVINYAPSSINFQGSITGTTLTVTPIVPPYPILAMNSPVTGADVSPGTIVKAINYTYTTASSADFPLHVFTATNLQKSVECSINGYELIITSNPNNVDLSLYEYPLLITGGIIQGGTRIVNGTGTTYFLNTNYPSPVSGTIDIIPETSITFSGSITSNVLSVYNASLASMIVPFRIQSASYPGHSLIILSLNPITYTVNNSQSIPSRMLTANVNSGIYTALNTLSTILSSYIIPNINSLQDTLTYLPQLMQACDNVNNACIYTYSYYYTTILPNDNKNFGLLSFLIRKYQTTVQYTKSMTMPTLFWDGTPTNPNSPVFNTYSSSYTSVQSGQVKGIAVYGSTIVMVGQFFRDTAKTAYLGSMITSLDSGATWSVPFDPGYVSGDTQTYIANAIVYTGYAWVATGRWSSGSVAFSSNGLNWSFPVNPLNDTGTGLSLAFNSTALLLGGSFTKTNGSTGSISVASGNAIGFAWSSMIRPTPLLLNTVNLTNIKGATGAFIAVGQWLTIAGSFIASIYASSDAFIWTPATLNAGITEAICYSACTNGTVWIAVGRFEGSAGSILVSDTASGTTWLTTPKGPGNLTTGTGYDCIFDSSLFFIVGSWSNGVLMVTSNVSTTRPPAVFLTGTTAGTAYSIIVSGLNKYLIGGSFFKTDGTYGTLSQLSSVYVDNLLFSCTTTTPISPINVNTASSLSVCRSIATNSTIYVAVGLWKAYSGDASISYSYDGVTWQQPINPNGVLGQGYSVKWNGIQFIATGSWTNGSVCVSSDGITWTTPTNPPNATGPGTSALWNPTNQRWLLSGNWSDANNAPLGNIISVSYGISFTPSFHPGSIIGSTSGLTWDSTNSTWIASGQWSDGTNIGYLAKSTNGLTWSNPYTPSSVSPSAATLTTVNRLLNRTFIGGAFTFINTPIQRSTDGITWAIQSSTGIIGTGYGVAWINSKWYVVGSFLQTAWGQGLQGPILVSNDGVTWNSIIQISRTDPLILAAIAAITVTPPDILTYSIDSTLYSIAYNGSLFLATGTIYVQPSVNGSLLDPVFVGTNLISTDGLAWSVQGPNLPSLLLSGSIGKSVAWNGSKFVLAGNWLNLSGATISFLLSSTNGLTWTVANGLSGITGQANSVAWNGYLWVAVGAWTNLNASNGILTTSVDGITWTTPIDPTGISGSSLSTITWNGTLFSAVGTANSASLTLISRDGLTWTYTAPALSSTTVSVSSLIIQPYLAAQPFDPSIIPQTTTLANQQGYTLQWPTNATYGVGTQYSLNLTDITFTITATQRTQWLSYGSFYGSTDVVQFTLTKLTPLKATFVSDLVGPHFSWTNSLGHALIDTVSLSIGGENVETIPGQLMEMLDEFQTPLEKVDQMSKLLCRAEDGFSQETFGLDSTSQTVVTPIPFWFSRGDPGCVLPIDALNVDEVRVTVNFKPITSLYYTDSRAAAPAQVEGGSLWPMSGSPFYYQDATGVKIPGLEPILNPGQTFLPFPNLTMSTNYTMPSSYLLVEYIYLDKAEANRFRIADIQVPIVQHYTIAPVDTTKNTYIRIPLEIPNPTRDIFFYCQRYEAPGLNAHFLASRDLSSYQTPGLLWWPDASGLYAVPRPGFSTRDSEPIRWLALNYAEHLNRYTTENVALFRSLLPAMEQRKAPWINRYYYNLPFGSQNGLTPFSMPVGEANLDKIRRFHLSLGFHGTSDLINDDIVDRYIVRIYGETYNIFRVYGGRGSMMFAY